MNSKGQLWVGRFKRTKALIVYDHNIQSDCVDTVIDTRLHFGKWSLMAVGKGNSALINRMNKAVTFRKSPRLIRRSFQCRPVETMLAASRSMMELIRRL